jgi:hypothetical protein
LRHHAEMSEHLVRVGELRHEVPNAGGRGVSTAVALSMGGQPAQGVVVGGDEELDPHLQGVGVCGGGVFLAKLACVMLCTDIMSYTGIVSDAGVGIYAD